MKCFSFRLSLELARKLHAVAKLYGARPTAFVRDMVDATCGGEPGKALIFYGRVQDGISRQRQLDLFTERMEEARAGVVVAVKGQKKGKRERAA